MKNENKSRRELYLDLYYKMCLVRLFEENINTLYQKSLATGAMHLSVGEEACAAGACSALRPEDKIVTTHRGHGSVICKGADVRRMIAELLARKDGCCKGRGGSMHIMDVSVGAMGAQGIVGASVPIAAGIALAAKRRGMDYVTLGFCGDGSSNNGAFHEGLNMAAVLGLPVVYLCINNGYAVTTKVSYSVKAESIACRAAAYGVEGVQVDGTDPVQVHDAVKRAVDKARSGGGPTLIEAVAYRRYGHFVGEPTDYRDKEEERYWREERDPIINHGKRLLEEGVCTQEDLDALQQRARDEIAAGNAFAESSPQPDFEELMNDVYFTNGRGQGI